MATDNRARNFSLTKPRYDQSSFFGRMRHFLAFTNPATVFVSESELEDMKRKLEQFKNNTLPSNVTEDELWRARYVLENTFARDGSKIPWPFRMSGYALGNLPVCVGMMIPNAGILSTVFWQWVNQTQNAFTNHYNRSSEQEVPQEKVLQNYLAAVVAAVSVAVSTKLAIKSVSSESLRVTLSRTVPFLSAATANVLNTYLMRRQELQTGINVKDKDGNHVGTSREAAKTAIAATCTSRVFMSFSLLGVPPFIYPIFERTRLLKKYPSLNLPMQFVVCAVMIFAVIPVSVALFSQDMEIASDKLEPEFAQKYPNTKLVFNKGL